MMNVKAEISKSFHTQAEQYEKAAKIQQEIGSRLFERLDYLNIEPRYVLDLGCGTGTFSALLKKKYPKAQLIAMDIAPGMLTMAKKKQGWRLKWPLVGADMNALPFAAGVFDLVFANQVIHWSDSLRSVLREINRVMNQNGCLMFSTLGPDTFKELKAAWAGHDPHAHVNTFPDMHDIGDDLLAERFIDPVVDMEQLTMHYASLPRLLASLKAQGVRNIHPQRNPGLTGKKSWQMFEQAYQQYYLDNGKVPLTYEVVYGHAWCGQQRITEQGTETFIPVSKIIR